MRQTYITLLCLTFPGTPALATDLRLRLPSWVSDETAPRTVEQMPVKPTKKGKQAQRPDKDPKPPSDPALWIEARPVSTNDATFSALRLMRTNQATLRLCDHRAIRLGQDPASRLRFRVVVDPRGQARVDVDAKVPISAAITRCYQTLASSWRYPATGEAYTLHLSRIAPNRR